MIDVDHVLIDTGSASTILAAREVADLGIVPEMEDIVYTGQGDHQFAGFDVGVREQVVKLMCA